MESKVDTPAHEEQQYLDLVRSILKQPRLHQNRTGIRTKRLPGGARLSFDLSDWKVPAFTTKRVSFKNVALELLMFLHGRTDSKEALEAHKVFIWKGNTSREALDAAGFPNRREGDMGPSYGHQWRHAGAPYVDCDTDYSGQGIDQVQQIIDKLQTNPSDRRMLVSAWNVVDLPNMTLPPCHFQYQVVADEEDKTFEMFVTMRSGDVGLGIPYNCLSYAILAHILAYVSGFRAVRLVLSINDAHVYENHIEALEEQLKREPLAPFPRLVIAPDAPKDIDAIQYQHLKLQDYVFHKDPLPKMPMAV